MDNEIVLLKDNRKLCYTVSGKPDGLPVFIFHGLPGCRFLPDYDISAASQLGIRVIVPDRPGFGMSDFQPDRTILNWADDVTALANHLGIDMFSVIGLSDGGPYAAACAYKIPQRLRRVVLVSSPAPYNAFGEPSELPSLLKAEEYATELAKKIQNSPDEFYEEIVAASAESDRESLTSAVVRDWLLTTFRETFRGGTQGWVHELMLLDTRPWGFPLEAITANVQIWHGDADSSFAQGQFLAEHIPDCRLHVLPDKGHIVPGLVEEIFKTFVA